MMLQELRHLQRLGTVVIGAPDSGAKVLQVRSTRISSDSPHTAPSHTLSPSLDNSDTNAAPKVNLLNLSPSLLTVPRTAPAARNRFLHLPGGAPGLQRIPASLPSLLVSPLARTLLPAVFRDAFLPANRLRPTDGKADGDESVDAFLTRRFGATFARTFGSALVHGIYAADSRVLSVRAAFPLLLECEAKGWGSVARGMLASAFSRKSAAAEGNGYELGEVEGLMKGVSVYSFREGMGELVGALEKDLAARANVEILKGDGAASLSRVDNGRSFEVS